MGSGRSTLRRTWPQRALITFNICVIVVALGTAGVFGYVNNKLSGVQRLALSGVLNTVSTKPGAPQNFLIVGTDSDVGLSASDPALQGRGGVTGARGDTIMVLHVDPKQQTASLLSLQRDLWVELAGQGGTHGRINSALGLGGGGVGGAKTLIATIETNFGIPINHYVEVDFSAFEKLVGAIGGIPIYFNTGIRDFDPSDGLAHTAIRIPGPGCYTLDPQQALAYARSRHMQYQRVPGDNSTWVNDNGNDYGRIQRQQDFIKRVMHRSIAKGIRDPVIMNQMVNAMVASVRMDGELNAGTILDLGRTFRTFNPDELKTSQLPVKGMMINGASVLQPLLSQAQAMLAPFRGTTGPSGETVGSITVEVHNGTGRSNEATNVSRALQTVGFQLGQPSDELGVTQGPSIIRYRDGQEADATLLARYLDSDVTFEKIASSTSDSADLPLVLVTGTSFKGVLTVAKAASRVVGPTTTSTTTTVPTEPGSTSSTTGSAATTTTIPGYLPGAAPPGVHCG